MKSSTTFYKWFPVVPFMVYWIASALAYEVGPFVNPKLDAYTYLYLFAMFGIFVLAYATGLKSRYTNPRLLTMPESKMPYTILLSSVLLTLAGTFLMVVDRLSSGAGSFHLVNTEMENIRPDYAINTTWLTTIAVIPQSFRLVAFSAYFYFLLNRANVQRRTHLMMVAIVTLELLNMALSANRGVLFWQLTYLLFYLIFCKHISITHVLRSRKYLLHKALAVFLVAISLGYFYFVARHREAPSTLAYFGQESLSISRYRVTATIVDNETLGAAYRLFTYCTHEFLYIDAFLKHAKFASFDPISGLGSRFLVQIQRVWPEYVPEAKLFADQSLTSAALSPYGWPSIFGWPLAMYGIFGAGVFFGILGFLSGRCVRAFLKTMRFEWFLLVFVVYTSLNMSFDWILRDFEQYMALALAVMLILGHPGHLAREKVGLADG